MRIVGGNAKGVRLATVPQGVRPLSDMAREGLFSSISDEIPGARVLDLYAGTGAMGIEALSRGAASGTFVERSAPALRTIRENLRRTRLAERASVVGSDVTRFLMRDDKDGGPFDLVLADPPYEVPGPQLDRVLELLGAGWLDQGRWTVALTRAKRSSTPVIPLHFPLTRRLEYGDTLVLVFHQG